MQRNSQITGWSPCVRPGLRNVRLNCRSHIPKSTSSTYNFMASSIRQESKDLMQNLKLILTASVVLGMTAVATMNSAEARRYRHVVVDNNYLVSEPSCSIVPLSLTAYIFPAANWEPFFRRHVYRYGPILTCAPSIETTNAVSVRY
jgi:hypothetical protein